MHDPLPFLVAGETERGAAAQGLLLLSSSLPTSCLLSSFFSPWLYPGIRKKRARCIMDEFSRLPLLLPEWSLGSQHHPPHSLLLPFHPLLCLFSILFSILFSVHPIQSFSTVESSPHEHSFQVLMNNPLRITSSLRLKHNS